MRTAVNNKADLIRALSSHSSEIKAFGVKEMGLFGSFTKDRVQQGSDIDLLVDFEAGKKTYDNFMNLSFYLEDLLGREIELVTPQSLSKFIGPYILKETVHVPL